MSNVWYCIPSKRPPAESTVFEWLKAGYRVAVQRDEDEAPPAGITRDDPAFGGEKWPGVNVAWRPYTGYAEAVNYLIKWAADIDSEARWFVTGGDDILPDPSRTPEQIAAECEKYFTDLHWRYWDEHPTSEAARAAGAYSERVSTFGVMQPIGDDFGANPAAQDPAMRTPYIHRVAGSPWIGREFAERINGGNGPLWPEYWHCGEDEELQAVAIMLGVFWQRPDLTHKHMHWARPLPGERMAPASRMPAFLERANSAEEWRKYKALFNARKAAGFPGHQPKE